MATTGTSQSPGDRARTADGGGGLAALVLVAAAAEELARIVLNQPWTGFPAAASHTVGVLLVALWGTGAVAVLLRHASPGFGALAWLLSVLSPIAMLAHGMVTRIGGQPWGLLFVPGAVLTAVLLCRAFDGGEYGRLRSRLRHAHDER